MEEKVLAILADVLEDSEVTIETSQENNANWDSLRHLNLVVELESEFDCSFEPDEINSMKSVKDIMSVLRK